MRNLNEEVLQITQEFDKYINDNGIKNKITGTMGPLLRTDRSDLFVYIQHIDKYLSEAELEEEKDRNTEI